MDAGTSDKPVIATVVPRSQRRTAGQHLLAELDRNHMNPEPSEIQTYLARAKVGNAIGANDVEVTWIAVENDMDLAFPLKGKVQVGTRAGQSDEPGTHRQVSDTRH